MVTIVNARTVSGTLICFEIDGRHLRAVRQIEAPLTVPQARPLEELQDARRELGVFDAAGALLLPGGFDAHVHSRDPGLTHKETWQTLAQGAWRGGVTTVCDMPNTLPPTMTREAVLQKAAIARESGLRFGLQLGVGAANITEVGKLLSDPELPLCALKVFYGKTTGELMYDDLDTLGRSLPDDGSKIIVFHSEDQCTVDCNQARLKDRLGGHSKADFVVHSEIRSSAAAHASTRAILQWAASYRRPIHIAHVSTPLEVELVAEAKAAGLPVTCEVAPHHLLFSTDDYERLGGLVKMNPPLRPREEVEALRRLFGRGLIDVWATDHAPHTLAEKQVEVARCPSGVPGVEFFYQLLFACSAMTGLPAVDAVRMASETPARLFGFPKLGALRDGYEADFVLASNTSWQVRGEEVVSKCGWTPYDGSILPLQLRATWCQGVRTFMTAPR